MAETITAVVVTFNRKHLLSGCVRSLLAQSHTVDNVFILDNASTDGTPDMLREQGYLDSTTIEYIRMATNTGGAAGFHEGMKMAFAAGYDWIWMMDDDVTPAPDCLAELLQAYGALEGAFEILQPVRIDAESGRAFHYATRYNFTNPFEYEGCDRIVPTEVSLPYMEIVSPPFEGPLIHRSVISDVGEVDKSFFMVCDDADYFLRAHRKGHRTLLVKSAVMTRATPPKSNTCFFDWKDYYTFRNRIELDRRYGGAFIAVSRALFQFARMFVKSLRPSKRPTRLAYSLMCRAVTDGLKGVRGKTIMPQAGMDVRTERQP